MRKIQGQRRDMRPRFLDTIFAAAGLVILAAGVILGGILADHVPPVLLILVGIAVLVLGVMVLCREEGQR